MGATALSAQVILQMEGFTGCPAIGNSMHTDAGQFGRLHREDEGPLVECF